MLTADMVRARRRGDTLTLTPLFPDGPKGERAREELLRIAERMLQTLQHTVGQTREEVDAALDAIGAPAALKKVATGLRKLALDACEFEAEGGDDAPTLRAALFAEAAARRRAANAQSEFSVEDTLADFAARRGLTPEALRARLFADLRGQHVLLSAAPTSAVHLLGAYELGQAQAVLLRASEVRVVVTDPHAPTLRYLFHKLKFHGLMYTITPLDGAAPDADTARAAPKARKGRLTKAPKETTTRYAITLSGPLSLFQASTKYGLALALTLPALRACEAFELEADVLWGPNRDRLRFMLNGGRGAALTKGEGDDLDEGGGPHPAAAFTPAERPEVEALFASFEKQGGAWQATRSGEILNVPGLGVCVPDLTFTERETGRRVHLEVLGFWSRDAVFRRMELARAGLDTPVIFAVPARLRVSEEALEDGLPASLYVFKGVLSRKAVLERLVALTESP